MDNQPSFDRSLLLPIGVGIFALLGICAILISGRLNETPAVVEEVPTATAFQYAFIGTEPAITTMTMEPSQEASPTGNAPDTIDTVPPVVFDTPTLGPQNTSPPVPTNTLASFITLPPLVNTSTPSRTPTSAFSAPFESGTYDDLDSRFAYLGDWESVGGATFRETLHVSSTLRNSVSFLYRGQELLIGHQEGASLGTISLTLDGVLYPEMRNQADVTGEDWNIMASKYGVHTVTITHVSGGSVNINYIIVPVVPLTPSRTPTSNNQ